MSVYRIRGLVHRLSPSLFFFPSFAISRFLFPSLLSSLLLYLSLSFSRNLLSRVTARARPLFFPSFRIPNFIFIGRRFRARARARARFVARISRNNGLPRGELNRKRIKSSCHPAPPRRLALVTPRLRQRYFERRIWDETLIGVPRVRLIILVALFFLRKHFARNCEMFSILYYHYEHSCPWCSQEKICTH